MLLRSKTYISLILGFTTFLSSYAFAAPCEQVTDTNANLASLGLARQQFTLYYSSGDDTYLGYSSSASSTVYIGNTGQGYTTDPVDCGGSTGGGWSSETIAGMSVYVYTPSGEPSIQPHAPGRRPLMLSLHGCNQTNNSIRDHGNWVATAEAYNMVVAVPDSVGSQNGNCWNSFGDGHTYLNNDNDNVIALAESLRDNAAYNIDENQIYIAGLSSGGMQSMLVACMRPDLFAGVGLNANPTIGTYGLTEWGNDPAGPEEGLNMCRDLASSTGNTPSFDTQMASIVFGDDTVTPGGTDEPYGQSIDLDYFPQNANIMATIYGAEADTGTTAIAGYSSSNDGVESTWSKDGVERVSMLDIDGLGHAWPSGNGVRESSVNDVNGLYVDYPAFVTAFFYNNNQRVGPVVTPTPTPVITPVPPTPTPVITPVPPTPTPVITPVPPTPTPVITPVPPTPTPVITPAPPTPTPFITPAPPTPMPECESFTAMNYYHKTAGRAYSTGYWFAPDYFAQGSNHPMSGSTYGQSTLRSYNGSFWEVGSCPQ